MISECLTNKTLNKVKELKMTKSNLNDDTVLPILKALEVNTYVVNLNIAKNNLSDKSVDSIINLINKNKLIKTLYLTNNSFSTAGKDKLKSYGKSIKLFL
jgi:hypothetical protein